MVIIRRFLALILVFAVAAAISLPAVAGEDNDMKYFETKTFYKNILEKEIKYLKKLQFQNGAIGMYEPGADAFAGFVLPEVEGISPEEYTKWPSASGTPILPIGGYGDNKGLRSAGDNRRQGNGA